VGWLEFFVLLFAAISAVAAVVTVRQSGAALRRAERVAKEDERHRRLTLLGRSAEAAREMGRLATQEAILECNYAQAEREVALAALGPEPPLPITRTLARMDIDEEITPDIAAEAREALTEIADALIDEHPSAAKPLPIRAPTNSH
jgi:hypothetical protein